MGELLMLVLCYLRVRFVRTRPGDLGFGYCALLPSDFVNSATRSSLFKSMSPNVGHVDQTPYTSARTYIWFISLGEYKADVFSCYSQQAFWLEQ